MTQNPIPAGPPRTSTFEDVIHYTSTLSSKEILNIANDPRLLMKKALLLTCAEWYTITQYAWTRLAHLEWEIENPDLQQENIGLQYTIEKLHSWRRRLPLFRRSISEVLENIIKRESFMSSSHNHLLDLQRDFEILQSTIEDLQLRSDRIMAVVTAVMSIEESRKAVDQNRSLARLTWLAVTFIPLSFVTSLFSMNGDLSTLTGTFRVFFAVALPMTAVVLFLTRFANQIFGLKIKDLLQMRFRATEKTPASCVHTEKRSSNSRMFPS